ncbi:hypothetical protein QWZ17_21300 [Mucilaginibacter flavus]|nr:hypothetical protein [Mucilaginibacter flavus]MDN3583436.1 hypothetical protein [Mucilaginibacter flavus]
MTPFLDPKPSRATIAGLTWMIFRSGVMILLSSLEASKMVLKRDSLSW